MGLQTLLGLRRQGFFIPYRYADGVVSAQPVYAALAERFAAAEPVFLDLLRGAEGYAEALLAIAKQRGVGQGSRPAPEFDQDWFPTLDAVAAYALVRQFGPKRIVEVGSGHSTRFLVRAVQDAGLSTEITAVDPQPRAALTGLPVRFHNAIMQTADPAIFAALEPGDVLFIDSSHILMPGTDVDWLFNRVLPALPPGVLVHVHDIFLPDDYPADWVWRGYNEQQAIGPLLAGGFQPVFSSHYVWTRQRAAVQGGIVGRLPQAAGAYPASLWLIRPA